MTNPLGGYDEAGTLVAGRHLIRETAWFGLGALARGDGERGVLSIEAVLDHQFIEPQAPWHGTFPIFAESPRPGPGAVEWIDFDPNWRQFIGVTLALIVDGYAKVLPISLLRRCEQAVRRCVEGEPADRIPPSYTDPALLHAWLARWVGHRTGMTEFAQRWECWRVLS
jgi:hypothetical protein